MGLFLLRGGGIHGSQGGSAEPSRKRQLGEDSSASGGSPVLVSSWSGGNWPPRRSGEVYGWVGVPTGEAASLHCPLDPPPGVWKWCPVALRNSGLPWNLIGPLGLTPSHPQAHTHCGISWLLPPDWPWQNQDPGIWRPGGQAVPGLRQRL